MPLDEVGAYIAAQGHLPGVPAAADVARDGVDVGETEAMLLGKIEELTLYLLEMHKENETMRREMAELRKELGR